MDKEKELPDQRYCSLCTRGKLECVCVPKELPTAEDGIIDFEEYLEWYVKNQKLFPKYENWRDFVLSVPNWVSHSHYVTAGKEFAVLFAKWHVKECKEAIKDNAKLVYIDGSGSHVCEDSIENAYKEEEIR